MTIFLHVISKHSIIFNENDLTKRVSGLFLGSCSFFVLLLLLLFTFSILV